MGIYQSELEMDGAKFFTGSSSWIMDIDPDDKWDAVEAEGDSGGVTG